MSTARGSQSRPAGSRLGLLPLPTELGFTRVRHLKRPKSDKSDFGWERESTELAARVVNHGKAAWITSTRGRVTHPFASCFACHRVDRIAFLARSVAASSTFLLFTRRPP